MIPEPFGPLFITRGSARNYTVGTQVILPANPNRLVLHFLSNSGNPITFIMGKSQGMEVQWNNVAGERYRFSYKDDGPIVWGDLSCVIGAGTNIIYTNEVLRA